MYEYKLMDLVSDCSWNPKYNMFAVAGFGQEFPVLVYVYERTQDELTDALTRPGGVLRFGTTEGEAERNKQKMESRMDGDTLF